MDGLLTIGEFAERTGLSRSALRFYDQNALVRPHVIDEDTGYRYYAAEQLADALLIYQLREAELPVASVRQFLAASTPERMRILDRHNTQFRARLDAVERIAEDLRADLARQACGLDQRWCTVSADEFAAALNLVAFAVARPEDRLELAVIWIEAREQSLRIVATDSYRLAVRDIVPSAAGGGQVSGAIDPARAKDIRRGAGEPGSLVLWQGTDGSLGISQDDTDSVIGENGTEFPDYERILSALPTGEQAIVAPDAFEHALAESPSEHEHIELRVTPEAVTVKAGAYSAKTATSWSAAAVSVWLDRRYLLQAVQATVGPDLAIEVIGPLEPVTLRSADTGTFNVLTMPVRPPDSV